MSLAVAEAAHVLVPAHGAVADVSLVVSADAVVPGPVTVARVPATAAVAVRGGGARRPRLGPGLGGGRHHRVFPRSRPQPAGRHDGIGAEHAHARVQGGAVGAATVQVLPHAQGDVPPHHHHHFERKTAGRRLLQPPHKLAGGVGGEHPDLQDAVLVPDRTVVHDAERVRRARVGGHGSTQGGGQEVQQVPHVVEPPH